MEDARYRCSAMTTPEDSIRARRRLTNRLIAAKDAARLAPFFDHAVVVIVGDGSLIAGRDQVLAAFAAQFGQPGFLAYLRETERVTLDANGDRAAEHGRWTGTWRDQTPITGQYLAVWKKMVGQWVIEQELYVTLS
jgi:ketosteroid isomerase-like protein